MSERTSRDIDASLPARRRSLLYFFYSARQCRVKSEVGIKSKICKALRYSSDGHFYHDLNILIDSGLLMEKAGYYEVTERGKRKFPIFMIQRRNAALVIGTGITLIFYYTLIEAGLLATQGIAAIGVVLVLIGFLFLATSEKYVPKLTNDAMELLAQYQSNE